MKVLWFSSWCMEYAHRQWAMVCQGDRVECRFIEHVVAPTFRVS